MEIRVDDPRREPNARLLTEHLADMAAVTPPESVHTLPIEGLCAPDVTFWTVWEDGELLGCGALRELDPLHGEIKSMRTAPAHLRKGIGAALLRHIIAEAHRRRYTRLSLETGSFEAFAPARALYTRFGFTPCEPFADYVLDPNSAYLTLAL